MCSVITTRRKPLEVLLPLLIAANKERSRKRAAARPQYYLIARVNGETFSYHGSMNRHLVHNQLSNSSSSNPAGYLFVEAGSEEGRFIRFLTDTGLPGKPASLRISAAEYGKGHSERYDSRVTVDTGAGRCTITKIDDRTVEGIFHFDVYSSEGNGDRKLTIRDGSFRLPY